MRELKTRTRDDRGVTAVLAALLITALIGSAAISVDYGHAVFEQRRVQKAADAAARSVATDCALDPSTCSTTTADATITSMVGANARTGATAARTSFSAAQTGGSITVQARDSVDYQFARIFGNNTKGLHNSATGQWALDPQLPIEGYPILPLGISYCTFKNNSSYLTTGAASSNDMLIRTDTLQAVNSLVSGIPILGGTLSTIVGRISGTTEACTNGAGESISMLKGGVWLSGVQSTISGIFDFLPSQCKLRMSSDLNVKVGSLSNGLVVPDNCVARLTGMEGKTVLLPVYVPKDNLNTLGLSVTGCVLNLNCVTALSANVVGFVPFKISGWRFGTSVSSPPPPACSNLTISLGLIGLLSPTLSVGCNGLQGSFVRTVYHNPDFTYGGSSATSELAKLFLTVRLTQ